MTISVNFNPQQFTGTDEDTALDTSFLFFVASDIVVTQRITATGVPTVLTLNVHYTVTGGSATGAVGVVTPLDGIVDFTSDMTWTLERALPITQATDYIENDSFPAVSHETALDRQTMLRQDADIVADRSLRFPITDLASLTSELPNSVDRASKVLAFDTAGSVTTLSPTGISFDRVLLDEKTGSASATLDLTSTDWPATYASVVLEVIGARPSLTASLSIEPIDSGTPVTANLDAQFTTHTAGTAVDGLATDWDLPSTGTNALDDAVSGSIEIWHWSDFLAGHGRFMYRSGLNQIMCVAGVSLDVAGTRWDGFQVSFTAGTITSGTFRLWGLHTS